MKLLKRWDEVKGKYASKLASIITGSSAQSKNANKSSYKVEQNHSSVPPVSERPERAREAKITKKLLIQESDSEEEEFGAMPKRPKTATSP